MLTRAVSLLNLPDAERRQLHYSELSSVVLNYDKKLASEEFLRDKYFVDRGHIDVITRLEQVDSYPAYYEQTAAQHEAMMTRSQNSGYILKITRTAFDKVVPRRPPPSTTYPDVNPFSIADALHVKETGEVLETMDGFGSWQLSLEYDDDDTHYYVQTRLNGRLHGPTYIVVKESGIKYLGSYNNGYKDRAWETDNIVTIYNKDTILSMDDSYHKLNNAELDLAPNIRNSNLLLYDPSWQMVPEIIDGVIVSEQVDYY